MKTIFNLKALMFLFFSLTFVQAQAQLDDDQFGYDYIVKELSQSRSSYGDSRDILSNVMIHGGVALSSSHLSLNLPTGAKDSGFLQGFEASLGIDLFSKYWLAEGAVRSFSSGHFGTSEVDLQEFDLRIVHRSYFGRYFRIRAGFGLAARYLNYKASGEASRDYTTPSSIFLIGAVGQITRNFSVGAELTARNSMVGDTIDDQAFDAAIKLGTHF